MLVSPKPGRIMVLLSGGRMVIGPARLICAWCTARWRIEFIAWRRLSQSSEGLKVALGGIGSLFDGSILCFKLAL